jgi:hypothetical protein
LEPFFSSKTISFSESRSFEKNEYFALWPGGSGSSVSMVGSCLLIGTLMATACGSYRHAARPVASEITVRNVTRDPVTYSIVPVESGAAPQRKTLASGSIDRYPWSKVI